MVTVYLPMVIKSEIMANSYVDKVYDFIIKRVVFNLQIKVLALKVGDRHLMVMVSVFLPVDRDIGFVVTASIDIVNGFYNLVNVILLDVNVV